MFATFALTPWADAIEVVIATKFVVFRYFAVATGLVLWRCDFVLWFWNFAANFGGFAWHSTILGLKRVHSVWKPSKHQSRRSQRRDLEAIWLFISKKNNELPPPGLSGRYCRAANIGDETTGERWKFLDRASISVHGRSKRFNQLALVT